MSSSERPRGPHRPRRLERTGNRRKERPKAPEPGSLASNVLYPALKPDGLLPPSWGREAGSRDMTRCPGFSQI